MNQSESDDALVVRLLELPAAERAACWRRLCTERPGLTDAFPEVTRHLEADGAPGGTPPPFSAKMVARAFESALDPGDRETVGTHIGPYKLIQKIGEGGFGTVWMADQQVPLRRRVALKIIKLGLDTDEVIARFEVERQALALMDHPNIARVFDAGATASGRPFFVMELVRGVPITQYCDENRLTATARLQLFTAVCSAVQHAHQKGVIHRDLKPSNILVTLHDGVPVPKIIDFGIAKATDKRLTDKTLVTQFHAFVGTPVYTSPEQMEMSGLDVDTRSDIYSLGVLLYELLAGRLPFDAAALVKSGLEAMRRTIREVDPPRPSHRLGTLTEADRTSVAQQRGTDGVKLALLLRGDVDWIVMRCLEKDRTRRYDTAAALAADIQHHLRNEPILARPPGELYRMRKFVRRHRFGVAAVAAIVVLLVGGLITASTLFVRERLAHRRASAAEAAESQLRQQAETARQLETKRVARTALMLADQFLENEQTADGLAYLVHAAHKDPENPTVAPRLASVLTTRNFLVPQGPPLRLPAAAQSMQFFDQGRKIGVICADGSLAVVTAATGDFRLAKLPSPVASDGYMGSTGRLLSLLCRDQTVRVFDLEAMQVVQEFRFGKNVTTRRRHGPSSPIFFVRLEDDTLRLCDAATGRAHSIPIANQTDYMRSPDGRWLLTAPVPWREIQLRDTAAGEIRGTLRTSEGEFLSCAISPDGQRLATAQTTPIAGQLSLRIWSVPDARPISEPYAIGGEAGGRFSPNLFFSPEGQFLVFWGRSGIELRDGVTGILKAPPVRYVPAAFNYWLFTPDLRSLLTWAGSEVAIWDLADFRPTGRSLRQQGEVQEVNVSDDSRVALVASKDGLARLWEVATGRLIAELPSRQQGAPVCALSLDGSAVALGTETGELRQFRVGRGMRALNLPWPEGRRRPTPFLERWPAGVLSLRDDRAVAIDATSGQPLPGGFSYPNPKALLPLANNPDLSSDRRHALVRTTEGSREVWAGWELSSAGVARVVPLQGIPSKHELYLLSANGEQIAFVWGSLLRVWRTSTGEPAGPEVRFPGPIFFGDSYGEHAFSPDGRRIAVGGLRGQVRVYEIVTGNEALRLPLVREAPVAVRFSPDGTRLLVANRAGDAQLFDATTGQPASPLLFHPSRLGASFSPDGRTLATHSQSTIRLWDGHTGEFHGEMVESEAIRSIAWDSDGTRLVQNSGGGGTTDSRTGRARVWDVRTRQPVSDFMLHPDTRVVSAVFSPDGRLVKTEAIDKFFRIWPVPPPLPAGATTPEWLLDLATLCAGKTIDADGNSARAPGAAKTIEMIRRALGAQPPDAPYAEWGRWFLADLATRSIAPGFTITPAEADRLAAELNPPGAAPATGPLDEP